MRACDLNFEETVYPLDEPETAVAIRKLSPAGKVPFLTDGEHTVWDSIAIIEYLHERFPDQGIWPSSPEARAHARSISAEMHSGFVALRRCGDRSLPLPVEQPDPLIKVPAQDHRPVHLLEIGLSEISRQRDVGGVRIGGHAAIIERRTTVDRLTGNLFV